ncbi:MAG: hypothetical protein EOO89_29450 [Pedobacter sp.]|nr:MAG: hypothetical protein EOO89_29450 [Pedobacter sp.]
MEKKIPGKRWEYMVYDKLDRPVATGPALNPYGNSENGWLVTKYDIFDRIAYTAWQSAPTFTSIERNAYKGNIYIGQQTEQFTGSQNIGDVDVGYSNQVYPITDLLVLTVNYYDGYGYPNAPVIPSQIFNQNIAASVINLSTGSWVRILDDPSSQSGEASYVIYDSKYRPLREYSERQDTGGYIKTDNEYMPFNGMIMSTNTYHKKTASDAEFVIKDSYKYFDNGLEKNHYHQINVMELKSRVLRVDILDVGVAAIGLRLVKLGLFMSVKFE